MSSAAPDTSTLIALMVEQQIRTWDVFDERVLELFPRLPRERFLPEDKRNLAYFDFDTPFEEGQRMLPPKVEARFLAEIHPQPEHKALHVGTGTGYFAALLAGLCAEVHTVEIRETLAEAAAARLAAEEIGNATVHCADGARGFADEAPYDIIVLTGSTPLLAPELVDQLKPEGRLLAPVGSDPIMAIRLLERAGGQRLAETDLFEYYVDPLENAPKPSGLPF